MTPTTATTATIVVPKWLASALMAGILGFTGWAATSIAQIKEENVAQKQINIQIQQRMDMQQATISTFQNVLGDIKTELGSIKKDTAVTRTMLEERTR